MEVKDKVYFDGIANYSIEWGDATWTESLPVADKEKSVRNRYDKAGGGYNHAGSSEISWDDFKRMISESIKRRHFDTGELSMILKDIADCIDGGEK